ncbi:hypothetical protein ACHQM5_022398 [Ranunculus cassubicifolius]
MELLLLGTANRVWPGLIFVILVVNSLGDIGCKAQELDANEAQMFRQISSKLNVSEWDVSPRHCIPNQGNTGTSRTGKITCSCENSTCHITSIKLVSLNMTGELLHEFSDLPKLRELDLTDNMFTGCMRSRWAFLPLVNLSLAGNSIGGSIPWEFRRITTLENLNLEDNKMEGPLPPELGVLVRLRKVLLSGNNFTGPLPNTFANLTNLTHFEIRGTIISGRIPEFIGNWTNLDVLDMQGTSMNGPIPSTISLLTSLTRLMISDLNVSSMTFPDLRNLINLKKLVLRNCAISGTIPSYIGEKMGDMTNLDLSFNMLHGRIPESLKLLSKLKYMYLTNNSLTGEVSPWLLSNTERNIDISYNNFTGEAGYCNNTRSLNQISSYSLRNDDKWCLKKGLPCPHKPRYYNVFINCGGGRKQQFEEDDHEERDYYEWGPSTFISTNKWAYSSTGNYMGSKGAQFRQTSNKQIDDIYSSARLAPLSLKYYGRCLRHGQYSVKLHFSEIILSSQGRRIFDIYIQGERVQKDFNIAEEAGGINMPIIKQYNATVTNSTLEIHLYWSGKGTMSVGRRDEFGQYGPLISAIAITPNFNPHPGLSIGAIAGIVVASLVGVLLILVILHRRGYLEREDVVDEELRGLELQTGYFTLRQIKSATGNFSDENKIGQGGFGPVYKGALPDGSEIAVKQLSSKSQQGNREFLTEIGMLSALQHPHLVKLFGCCIEGNQLLIIYEYMENNSLARALFGPLDERLNLDWPTRQEICLGIARGLVYLHEESRLKIVHRDMKATNVLLDKDLNAKICDFGLAKLDNEVDTHISTRIAGTVGYMAPEYAMRGYLTEKADVYSFGIVALEIVSGKSNTNYRPKEEFVYLLDWACVLHEQGNLLQLVDECLGTNYPKEEALNMLIIGLLCTNISPTLRPTMSSVVRMLEGRTPVEQPHSMGGSVSNAMKLKVLENMSQESNVQTSLYPRDSQRQSIRDDGPFVDYSSTSLSGNEEGKNYYSSTSKLLPDLFGAHLPE